MNQHKVSSFPSMVVVSVTNACNYRCTHCYHPAYSSGPDYHRVDMSREVIGRVAGEMSKSPNSVLRFIAWGEPLLHPRFAELLRSAREAAPLNKLTLITNGYLLNGDCCRDLMEAGLDMVEISLDAAYEETYRRVRVSSDPDAFQRVNRNARDMVELRNRRGYRTKIVTSFVEWPTPESEREFKEFDSTWRGVADDVVRRPVHTFKGTVDVHRQTQDGRKPCYGLWARCFVNPLGQVSVCYNDWENRYVLGDLNEPGACIADIWDGDALNELRRQQCEGVFAGCCGECRDFNPLSWERPYERVIEKCFDDAVGRTNEPPG